VIQAQIKAEELRPGDEVQGHRGMVVKARVKSVRDHPMEPQALIVVAESEQGEYPARVYKGELVLVKLPRPVVS
jgi:hypothetical protein